MATIRSFMSVEVYIPIEDSLEVRVTRAYKYITGRNGIPVRRFGLYSIFLEHSYIMSTHLHQYYDWRMRR